MLNDSDLNKARLARHDEFYTRCEDIDKELCHYKSKFFEHFVLRFNDYKLKKLIAIGYADSNVGGEQLHFNDIAGLGLKNKNGFENRAFKVEINKKRFKSGWYFKFIRYKIIIKK